MAAARVLLVEDDPHIGAALLRALVATGYQATWARTGGEGIAAFEQGSVDLVLLDLGLPDQDGLDVCRHLHDVDPLATVVILTARDEELDIVIGLDAGAVDYVTKPFTLAELLARVRAQLRRRSPHPGPAVSVGDLRIEGDARRVWIADTEVGLRPKEFDLLERLVRDVGKVVTRGELMADVWDEHWFGSTKTLDFHVAALRRKVDVDGAPSRITTLRGVGYRFEDR
ncbi:MAG: DNA-binding response regulator [Acidimicrobiales bacterium]|nr:DNA-binding response regulator [Acidimicrobiales bacterium]